MIRFSLVFLFFSSLVFAHDHREHGAHEHGAGNLSIAFDQEKGRIEFRGAAEGILGFEHKARTAKDKKTLADATNDFEKKISDWIAFDSSLACVFKSEKIAMVPEAHHDDDGDEAPAKPLKKGKTKAASAEEGEHSDFVANYTVNCAKSPRGTNLAIDFTSQKLLKDLDVTILVDDLQRKAEAKGERVQISLK